MSLATVPTSSAEGAAHRPTHGETASSDLDDYDNVVSADEEMGRESMPLEMTIGAAAAEAAIDFLGSVKNEERDMNSNILIDAYSTSSVCETDQEGQSADETSSTVVERNGALSDTDAESVASGNRQVGVVQTYSLWNLFNYFNAAANEIEAIENNIFKPISTKIKRFFVNIRNGSLKIWTMAANTESSNVPVVLIHGFCGGIGLWVHNIDALAEQHPFYAFDLLGFGRSSRPSFSTDPIVAETQFVESIEDWRKAMNLEQMIVLGHSFGGYLSCAYALKYPQNVKALILADPWGFPENSPTEKPDTPRPLWVSVIAKCSQYVSPLSFIRMTGKMGVSLFKYLRPDFKRKYMSILDDPEIVYDYLYHANRQNPTGEAGFRAIAQYFGFAKNPMIRRIDKIKHNIPIWFIYGSRSWIDSTPGFTAVYLRQRFAPISVKLIVGAGHHVYADKPVEFNEYAKYILEVIGENEEYSEENYEEAAENQNSSSA